MSETIRLIVDTDIGVDDAQALMLALTHPDARVEAITAVVGNTDIDNVCANIGTLLDVMNADVPFYRGAALPLVGEWEAELTFHGSDGLGDWAQRAYSDRQPEPEHAVMALLRLVNESPGEYTLVTLGPLTNIALAIRLDPTFAHKIGRWVCMGGNIRGQGNTQNPGAEWNIYCDPEAAFIAFSAIPQVTLVSWEATIDNPLWLEDYDRLAAINHPRARFFHGITESTRDYATVRGVPGFLLPDPLAMAVALEPSLILESFTAYTEVELGGRLTRGMTVIDHDGKLNKPENSTLVTRIDMAAVLAMYERALSG